MPAHSSWAAAFLAFFGSFSANPCVARKPSATLALGIGQARLGMERRVDGKRHVSVEHGFDSFVRVFLGSIPGRKIEMKAPSHHVVRDQPRHGRNGGIPRPNRLVAMAIEARADGQLACCRAIPGGLLRDGRVVVIATKGHELDQHEHREHEETKLSPLTHGRIVIALQASGKPSSAKARRSAGRLSMRAAHAPNRGWVESGTLM